MTPDELLGEHTPEIASLARQLLDHVTAAFDWSEARVYPGWHGIGFHSGRDGYVVGVFPRTASVRVLFEHGNLLGEAPFLEGSGQTRYVEFVAMDAARLAAVDDVLERALAA
jgi:hypothetical protein